MVILHELQDGYISSNLHVEGEPMGELFHLKSRHFVVHRLYAILVELISRVSSTLDDTLDINKSQKLLAFGQKLFGFC